MSDDKEISDRIDILQELNEELDDFDKQLDVLFTNKENNDYIKLMEEINPKERLDLNWDFGYSTYTLYYIYLKLQNVDPREHEIKDEMKRLQDFHSKIKDAKEGGSVQVPISNINKEACERMIKNLINSRQNMSSDNTKTSKRYIDKAVPVPEQIHMNCQKNQK